MKLQAFLVIVLLAMAIQGWAACSNDQNKKILQFNPRLALGSGTFSEENSGQLILLNGPELKNLDQTSEIIPMKSEIGQDLKAVLQIPLDTNDISSAIGDQNQDDWIMQMESSFSQILELQIGSDELEKLSSELSTNQAIINEVNSNIMSLMSSYEGWDVSWGVDLGSERSASFWNDAVTALPSERLN